MFATAHDVVELVTMHLAMPTSRVKLFRLKDRVRAQGLWATLTYLFVTGLAEAFGLRIHHVFSTAAGDYSRERGAGFHFEAPHDLSELSAADREALSGYGRETFLRDIARQLKRGQRCVVTRIEGRLAGMAWVTRSKSYAPNLGRRAVLIEWCFTLPEFRGRGAYPAMLQYALSPKISGVTPGEAVFVESSITNSSSVRGIMKAGFHRIGTIIGWGRHSRFLPIGKRAQ
jgi:hypothetical protein